MGKYKLCNSCHIVFDKRLKNCPSCGKIIYDEDEKQMASYVYSEGSGRAAGAGGEACNYSPHCYGSGDWCPIMGD